jgi:Fur family ferric uptake transcriptional regulator
MATRVTRETQASIHEHAHSHSHPHKHEPTHQPGVGPAVLREHGLRPTRIRLEVYRLLVDSGAPLSHTDVTEGLKKERDRVTIYRALDALVAHGLAHAVSFPDRKRRFAACVEHSPQATEHSDDHAHFICNNCAATLCVGRKDSLLAAVQRWLPKAYEISSLDVLLSGLCPRCRRAS